MAQWFQKRTKEDDLRVLKEREIQDKLYGQYRAAASHERGGEISPGGTSFQPPKFSGSEKKSSEHQAVSSERKKPGPPQWALVWKWGSVLLLCLVVGVLFFRMKWESGRSIHRAGNLAGSPVLHPKEASAAGSKTENSEATQARTVRKTPIRKSEKTSETKPAEAKMMVEEKNAEEQPESKSEVAGKVFSVQVCTYRTEADAQRLSEQLTALNLPAYYQSEGEQADRGSRFYVVLIGKEPTYTEAQVRLEEFKSLPIAVEFSDAYIRRV